MQRVVNEQHGNVGCARSICVSVKGGGGCQIALHNDSMFGLTKLDYDDLLEGKEKAWKAPSTTEKRIDRIRPGNDDEGRPR